LVTIDFFLNPRSLLKCLLEVYNKTIYKVNVEFVGGNEIRKTNIVSG
jgi:hypothetical protein